MKWKLLTTLLLCFILSSAKGQPLGEIEQTVSNYLSNIKQFGYYLGSGNPDSVEHYNRELQNYLLEALGKQPLTMTAKFAKIGPQMTIATSADKNLRIYSWDTEDGGTMHGFNAVAEYRLGNKIKTQVLYIDTFINNDWTGPGYFYSKIFSIKTKQKKTVYLAVRKAMYSTKDVSTGIQAFTIDNNDLNDTIGFFVTKKEVLNSIDCYYNWDGDLNAIKLSTDKQKLYIPLVDGEVKTKKNLVYVFDGNNFVFDKNAK